MGIAAILALLQAVPSLLQEAATIRANLSETDQSKLDASIDALKAAALSHVDQAELDLKAAGES